MQIEYTAAEDSVFFWIFTQKNEVGFDGQRSLLHSPTKPASFAIEACCIFDTGFLKLEQG